MKNNVFFLLGLLIMSLDFIAQAKRKFWLSLPLFLAAIFILGVYMVRA